jgi:hypothetical protein
MSVTLICRLPLTSRRSFELAGYTTRRSLFGDPRGWKLFSPCQGSNLIWSSQKDFLTGMKLSCLGMTTLPTVCHGYFSSSQGVPAYSTGWSSRFSRSWTWKLYSASCVPWNSFSQSLKIWSGCESGLTVSSASFFCVSEDGTNEYFYTPSASIAWLTVMNCQCPICTGNPRIIYGPLSGDLELHREPFGVRYPCEPPSVCKAPFCHHHT